MEFAGMMSTTARTTLHGLAIVIALHLLFVPSRAASAEEITVFAAASLKDALDEIGADWQKKTGNIAVISYGGSSALARQIQQGAPADLFFSASSQWMDTLETGGLIKPKTRHDFLGNSLVLVAHGRNGPQVEIANGFDLAGLLHGGKLAMALVDSVPAGQYGKQSLENLGVWDKIEPSVAQAENVRAALALVSVGEAPYGIVYASDAIAAANAGENLRVAGTFPTESHQPIIYPAALTTFSTKPEALEFLQSLSGEVAQTVFSEQGFVVLK
jgi:molybdate transport system substrate-binding protein